MLPTAYEFHWDLGHIFFLGIFYSVLTVVAADRPGLLFVIATQLAAHHANLHTAKIATLGERVEDTFLISGRHIEESAGRIKLETDLLKHLQP